MMILDLVMTVFTGLCICGVLASKRLLRSLMFLSAFGMIMTVRYVLLAAPDIAITEAALGAGLSSLVFLTAIKMTSADTSKNKGSSAYKNEIDDEKGGDHG